MRRYARPLLLVLALVLLAGSTAAISLSGTRVRAADYDQKRAAADIMQRCMDRIKQYKLERGIALSALDFHQTGMIGDNYTEITTTLGAIEAKRTCANSDMAALAVHLLHEAGVQSGDTVGAGFSGSFPSLNLAVMAACAAMDLRLVYISSVGASTYGANHPELTFPDMAWLLVQDGLLSTQGAAVSLGGQNDCGQDMDQKVVSGIVRRLSDRGIPLLRIEDHRQNIAARMEIYQALGPIDCFVGVGGNLTTMGRDYVELGQGLIRPNPSARIGPRSGLVEIYSARGIPVINLLNIKKLVADYGLAYDPPVLPEPGTSAVYHTSSYPRPAIAAALAGAAALLLLYKKTGPRPRG
jgi:poly-gamma-glutamate system protein